MGFPPPADLPKPGSTTGVSTPNVGICPTLPIPTQSFTLLPGGGIGSAGPLVGGSASITDADFSFPPSFVRATTCGFCIALPKFKLAFSLPSFNFPPFIPIPFLGIKLSCDPTNPVDVTANVSWGGGRKPNPPADPDLDEAA